MSDVPEWVTCLRCLYLLGWYVPLVKLREHQTVERLASNPCALRSVYTT